MKQLLIFISFMYAVNLSAQVTIGKLAEPHKAAILDLSQIESQNRGLLLPHVNLTGLEPFQLISSPTGEQKADAAGMVVYNDAHVDDDVYPGMYVWDGAKWGRINDGTLPPPPMPINQPIIMKSGADCGNGVLFYIPENYSDWKYVNNFVWTLTSPSPEDYKPVTVTSGSKNSHFFVPYDGTERNYEVSVYAEANIFTKLASPVATASQTGNISGTNNFFINGYNCYDIKKTPYDKDVASPTTAYGRWESRTALDSPGPDSKFSYSVLGSGTLTAWTIFDPDGILMDMSAADLTTASIDIQFKPWILGDDWLINQPAHERIVVLTCIVTDGNCAYVVSKEIRVGDRDCCARLTDAENNIYSAVRFGDAGCWMSENLAVTKNQKRNTTLTLGNTSGEYAPRYTFPSTTTGPHDEATSQKISLADAQNSNYYGGNEGKPGLLYNWAAAVGAVDGSTTNTSGGARNTTAYPPKSSTNPANDASRDASKDEDICPVGWYLPSDAEWSLLEREISDNYSQYSTASSASTWTETSGSYRGSHGSMMRNPTNIGSSTQSPTGVSKPKESGFSGLLVGYAASGFWHYYGTHAYYWSSSNSSINTQAWRRYLGYDNAGGGRNSFYKAYLWSVRCKKLD